MKPHVFIGSSTESLEIAYALQENLDAAAEVTVWTQGIFELSKFTLESLLEALDTADFGIFVFSVDDLSVIRGKEKGTVRDNVLFELGLFIGRLGKDRNFVILPRGHEETLHLPSDLLGLTPALFEPNRQDKNLRAALGPATSKLERLLSKLGKLKAPSDPQPSTDTDQGVEYSEGDKKAILRSWMGSRPADKNGQVIYFQAVDRELRLKPGTTKQFIKEIAKTWNYVVANEGEHTILFTEAPSQRSRGPFDNW